MTELEFKELLKKVIDGKANPMERSLVDTFYEKLGASEEVGTDSTVNLKRNKENIFRELNLPTDAKNKKHLSSKSWLKIAASFFAFTLLSALVILHLDQNYYENTHTSMLEVELPDGSQVLLYPNAKLKYKQSYLTKDRVLELEGDAFFDIQKIGNSKLLLHFGPSMLEVLGTSFQVASNDNGISQVMLFSGLVSVIPHSNTEKILIRPGEVLRYDSEHPQQDYTVRLMVDQDNHKETFNIDGIPLKSLMRIIDMKFGTTTKFSEKKIERLLIGGQFTFEDLEDTLAQISFIHNLKITIKDDQLMIYEENN
ncbi:FecR family protein [Belliella sp. DSM 111904]|uniref:FecR family protein n=1 Tax=Belliella filtrata TaxID=2923435 RepID=A0ABS9V5A4_9BACT|nr:FecR family protein [Belliella filtrata]MCH7411553.1 FecR family protein [Belliella filtrata]